MSTTDDTAPAHDIDELSDTFAALANPTRRAILARLAAGEATVNELAEPFEMTLPAISKHIGVLERAGLIDRRRRGTARPCVLARQRLRAARAWAEALELEWEARLDRLGDRLASAERVSSDAEPSADTSSEPSHNPTSNPESDLS